MHQDSDKSPQDHLKTLLVADLRVNIPNGVWRQGDGQGLLPQFQEEKDNLKNSRELLPLDLCSVCHGFSRESQYHLIIGTSGGHCTSGAHCLCLCIGTKKLTPNIPHECRKAIGVMETRAVVVTVSTNVSESLGQCPQAKAGC